MSDLEVKERLRQEQNIMDRIEGVKRLIQMETTLLTTQGARRFIGYSLTDREGKKVGYGNLLNEVREEIQLQLLSIVATCSCLLIPFYSAKINCIGTENKNAIRVDIDWDELNSRTHIFE